MKHFYTLFLLLCSAIICHAQIISQQPDGTLKYYQRTGGLTYLNDGSQLHLQNQAGFTEIVYSADGKTAWIKNPVSAFFPEGNDGAAWIKGEITDNSTKIKVNLGQKVFHDGEQDDYLEIALLNKDNQSSSTNYVIDPIPAQVVYTINGNKVSIDGTSEKYVFGLVWSSDKAWSGFADYQTEYTEYEIPDAVTPPAGMEVKEYPISAIEYMNEEDHTYSSMVNVGFDGNDVYIQGIDKFLPAAWIKGTLDGSTVTFPVQYIGTDPAQRRHFLTSWKVGVGGVDDVKLNYYADLDAFESTSAVLINSNPTFNNYYAYYRSMYIGDRPDVPVLPDGVQARRMTMTGKIDNTGFYASPFTRIIEIAQDGNSMYIKGMSADLPEAWVIGTIDGDKVTIPSGTFMGFGEASAVYLHGGERHSDGKDYFRDNIVFNYDDTNDTYTCDHIIFECSARVPRTYSWKYSAGTKIYFDPNAPSGADPDDLEQVSYIYKGKVAFGKTDDYKNYTNGEFEREVKMAFDGNLVYIKGISLECPDGWIKGELADNTVTFSNAQQQGTYNGASIYICGFDMMAWKNTDLTMSFNPDTKEYSFTQDMTVSTDPSNVGSYNAWIAKGATLTPDTSGIGSIISTPEETETVIYNLQGVRVQGTPSPGLYIVNGKKTYLK